MPIFNKGWINNPFMEKVELLSKPNSNISLGKNLINIINQKYKFDV